MNPQQKIKSYIDKIKNPPGKLDREKQAILLAFDTWVKQKRPFSDYIAQSGILEKYKEDLQKAKDRAKVFFLNQYLLYLNPLVEIEKSDIPLILEVINNQELLISEFKKVQRQTLEQIPEPVKNRIAQFLSRQKKSGFSIGDWDKLSADLSKNIDPKILTQTNLLCLPLFYVNIAEANLITLLSRFNYLQELKKTVDSLKDEKLKRVLTEIKGILPILEKNKDELIANLIPEMRSKIKKVSCFPPLTSAGVEPVQYLLDIARITEYLISSKIQKTNS